MNTYLIHIVDDDESVRSALSRLLRMMGYETRTYASAEEFLTTKRSSAPGCMILGIRMPGPSGLDLHDVLCREKNPLPVIFLTGHGDIPSTVRAMRSGAVDFLTKPVNRDEVTSAISRALLRDQHQRGVREQERLIRERYEKLTSREREVFLKVTDGRLNKQIAAELGTSERTIKAHRAHVMEKMCAQSVPELVRAADQLRCAVRMEGGELASGSWRATEQVADRILNEKPQGDAAHWPPVWQRVG